nr:phosphoribosyltransferase [Candidatus Njordarchaeum guaymaensis]
MKYQLLTWNECYKQCKEVAMKIRRSSFSPDVIVALARSGFVPGRIFSDLLCVDELKGLQVHHVMGAETPELGDVDVENEYEAVIPYKVPLEIKGRRTLVVDDIVGTGKSMTSAVQFLENLRPRELKTATLGFSTESIIRPDFFASTVSEHDWLLYPWNYFEDFSELIAKATKKLKQQDATPEVLAKTIHDSFGVNIPIEDLKYVLEATKESHSDKRQK